MTESNRIEYKRELSDTLEKDVVSFLNYKEGGVIYVGFDSSAKLVGLIDADSVQLKIKDRLKHNIAPSILGLFDVLLQSRDGKDFIKITLASGTEKPYYIRQKGMSDKGCFIRVGSSSEPMSQRMIEDLFSKRTRRSIGRIKSPRQDLTFEQLRIYYDESGFNLGDKFANSLELFNEDGAYNYAAYLLSDHNGTSVKVAKYKGLNRVDLIENNDYGFCSLIKACKQVLDKLAVENATATQITAKERIDTPILNPVALREAVINAIVHNDYSNEVPPKFELFANRLEITSAGGLPQGLSQDEFFEGYSVPRNKELMRVFKDLDLVEHLGSGVPRILNIYPRKIFTFSDNFFRTALPFDHIDSWQEYEKVQEPVPRLSGLTAAGSVESSVEVSAGSVESSVESSGKLENQILSLIKQDERITIREMAQTLKVTHRTLEKQIAKLKADGKLHRTGATKRGVWKIANKDLPDLIPEGSVESSAEPENHILAMIARDERITIRELAQRLKVTPRAIEKQITKLKADGKLHRVGATKSGRWLVVR